MGAWPTDAAIQAPPPGTDDAARRIPLCILHVGIEKTGTTSLQRFLGLNAARLLEQGVFAPRSLVADPAGGIYNHVLVSTASRLVYDEPDDLQRGIGLCSMDLVVRHRQLVIAALADEIAALARPARVMLVSNEHIHSRLRADAELRQARSLLARFCDRIKVVVYLRRQDEVARSLAMTALRGGATELRLLPDFSGANGFDPVLGVDFGYFDHAALLGRLADAFGADALDVRIYADGELRDGDTVGDFFWREGIDIAGLPRPARENASLAADAAIFLAKINAADAGTDAAMRQHLLGCLANAHAGAPALPARADAERFMALFADSNEAVRRRWFPGRERLFAADFDRYPETCAPATLDEGTAFRMFLACLAPALAR
jgi:hypothetical protein